MSRLQDAVPITPGGKGYDVEIKDMADYIHKYNVDSELAVRMLTRREKTIANPNSSTLLVLFSLIPSAAA